MARQQKSVVVLNEVQDPVKQPLSARKTSRVVALGLLDDPEADVGQRLRTWDVRCAETLRILQQSAHHGYAGDLVELVTETRRLVELIERQAAA